MGGASLLKNGILEGDEQGNFEFSCFSVHCFWLKFFWSKVMNE